MASKESDLVVVSLVRYADSCDPVNKHSDCPFAIEQDGRLTCNEECRGVITTMLRRGRAQSVGEEQPFDARQLRLSEPPGAPDIFWHTSSLLQVLVSVVRSSPVNADGTVNLRRYVDATSALAVLGYRGLDPDQIVRRGLAKTLKLRLAIWLKQLSEHSDARQDGWKHFDGWRIFFSDNAPEPFDPQGYITAALNAPTVQRLDAWINSAPIKDLLLLIPPSSASNSRLNNSMGDESEIWTWIVERFTETYLERWSLASLKREYALVRGSWVPDFPTELLADRVVSRESITAALADRALIRDDVVDPATMNSFKEQALSLLADGQRMTAAALFDAARALKPSDLNALNNYAFCILLDRPKEAVALLKEVLSRDISNPAVTWCNLALASSLLGDSKAALDACDKAFEIAAEYVGYLWQQQDGHWTVIETKLLPWVVRMGASLERSAKISGIWQARLEELSLREQEQLSSDPSSAERDEDDL